MKRTIAEYFGGIRDAADCELVADQSVSPQGPISPKNESLHSAMRLQSKGGGRVILLAGTRPEVIKLAPVYHALKAGSLDVSFVTTGQHVEMANQALETFDIVPDRRLDCLDGAKSLPQIQSRLMAGLEADFAEHIPDLVLVQGDTSTAMIGALTSFSMEIAVGHVEAGLSSGSKFDPYPEEMFRSIIRQVADLHFAPTRGALDNLLKDGIDPASAFLTGNTVVDAVQSIVAAHPERPKLLEKIDDTKRLVLLTTHRRESWGPGIESICKAVCRLAQEFEDIEIVWPVHLNPKVSKPVRAMMSGVESVHLVEPLNYTDLVGVLSRSDLVMTDSGGIQEEAPSFSIPTLVMRDVTERPEAVNAGFAKLVGKNEDLIVQNARLVLMGKSPLLNCGEKPNPFGDGLAGARIANLVESAFGKTRTKAAAE